VKGSIKRHVKYTGINSNSEGGWRYIRVKGSIKGHVKYTGINRNSKGGWRYIRVKRSIKRHVKCTGIDSNSEGGFLAALAIVNIRPILVPCSFRRLLVLLPD
jgi:hypothetical protein